MNDESSLVAGRWQVVFGRLGDRFAHEIRWRGPEGQWQLLFGSLEGADQQDWPASPPLQELHLERRSDELNVALLVGMAGSSHWSLVVEAHRRTERLVFEAACRVHVAPQWLGSTYQSTTAGEHARLDATTVQLTTPGGRLLLESEALRDTPAAALAYDAETRRLTLSPALASVERAHTFRWRYRLAPTT